MALLAFMRTHEGQLRQGLRWLLAVSVVVAFVAYQNFLQGHAGTRVQPYDFFHAYIGAKYFPELRYTRFYTCMLTADREEHYTPVTSATTIRLRNPLTQQKTLLQYVTTDPSQCRSYFTTERWASYKTDLAAFKKLLGDKNYLRLYGDHGFNATPFWVATSGQLTQLFSSDAQSLQQISVADLILLVSIYTVLLYGFGYPLAAMTFCLLLSQAVSSFLWLGYTYVRYDWIFYLCTGIALLKRKKLSFGAFFLTLATAVRFFPGIPLAVLCLWALIQQELTAFRKVLLGMSCALVFIFGITTLQGLSSADWIACLRNALLLSKVEASNFVGLPHLMKYFHHPLVTFCTYSFILLYFLLLFGRLKHFSSYQACLLSMCGIVCIKVANYYQLYFVLLALLGTLQPLAVILTSIVAAASWFASNADGPSQAGSIYWTILLCGLFALMLVLSSLQSFRFRNAKQQD